MGLDLALAVVVLIAAFRGWFQGFVSQTVRIASLIACVYLAAPVRDRAKPYVSPYVATIQPDLVDRLLWWVAAVVAYVALVGIAMLVIKMTRRPDIPGISETRRNDQFAGFLLGAMKGLLLAAVAAAGIQKYGLDQVKSVPWAEDQAKASWALQLSADYQPVSKLWSSRPVKHFVSHINRMGLQRPGESSQWPVGQDLDDSPIFRTGIRPADVKATMEARSKLDSMPPSRSSGSGLPAEADGRDQVSKPSGAPFQPRPKTVGEDSN
jgi:uncharacterized membrane protein required for colicin V production